MAKYGGGIAFAQQGKRATDHGGTGGQQSSVEGRLLRSRAAGRAVDRETHARSLVGSGVYDSRVVPLVGAVGSTLGGYGLVGLGRVVVAPRSALTRNLARVSSCSVPA